MRAFSKLERYLSVRMAHDGHPGDDGRIVYVSNLLGVPTPWLWDGSPMGPDPLQLDEVRTSSLRRSPTTPWVVLSQDAAGTERHQLIAVHLDTRERRQLTDDEGAIHNFGAFFPDGEHFTVAANRLNGRDFELYVGHVDGRALAPIVIDATDPTGGAPAAAGMWSAPAVSPDGRAIIVVESLAPSHQRVYRLDLEAGDGWRGHLTPLSPEEPAAYRHLALLDGQVVAASNWGSEWLRVVALDGGQASVLWEFSADVEALAVSGRGDVAVSVNREGVSEVHRRPAGSGAWQPVALAPGVVGALRYSPDGQQLVWDHATATAPMEVYRWAAGGGAPQRLTRSYRAGLREEELVAPRLVHIESFDGLMVPAWLYVPETPSPAPVIVAVHGGPESQARPGFSALYQYWLSLGIAVLAPNVRGSTGYGRRYEHLDDVALRGDAIRDLDAVAAWAGASPELDASRIVVYGGSYGGYMVMAGLTWFPERFCAGVEIVGIVNLETFLEHTSPWRRALREAEYGSLAHDREALRALSPIHRIDQIRVPLFVGHGKNDPRVPFEEATQVVAALEARGIPHEFLSMDDEGHGAVRWQNQRRLYGAIQEFLVQHAGLPGE